MRKAGITGGKGRERQMKPQKEMVAPVEAGREEKEGSPPKL